MNIKKLSIIQDQLYNSILEIIKNRDAFYPKNFINEKEARNPFSYKESFCTIKMSVPRRLGNTQIALKLLNNFGKDAIYIAKTNMLDECRMKQGTNKKNHYRLMSPMSLSFIGQKAKVVIVDCATYIQKKDMDNIYKIDAEFFVLLG